MKSIPTKLILTLLLAGIFANSLWAQDEQIKVRIETMEDGKKKVFERTYSNKEEMQADEELKELGLETNGEHHFETMVLSKSKDDESQHITIDVDAETEGEKIIVKKVIKGETGKEKVIERVYDSKEEMEADEDIDIRIIRNREGYEWSSDEEDIHIHIEKEDGESKTKVTKKVTIEIEEDDEEGGKKKKKKRIKVIEEEKDQNR